MMKTIMKRKIDMKYAPLLALALLAATPAHAADITLSGNTVTLKGFINENDSEKFLNLTLSKTNLSVVLDSIGGYNSAAANIGYRIRFLKWRTYVPDKALCGSACTLIWLAGVPREMAPTARLGFHTAVQTQDWSKPSEEGNQAIAKYMRLMDTPQVIIELQPMGPPCFGIRNLRASGNPWID
jgi:hypothetical protein